MTEQEIYQRFLAKSDDVDSATVFLDKHFRESKDFHRVFEVLKMHARWELGLPLLPPRGEKLPQTTQAALEEALVGVCREVGELCFAAGKVADGWAFLQPVGDEEMARRLLCETVVTPENAATLIDVGFYQAVAPTHAYPILIRELGTCDAITAYDSMAMQFDPQTIPELASQLLTHFHAELMSNVVAGVIAAGHSVDDEASLGDLLSQHAWLVVEGGHHLDASHLASVVRIARQTDEESDHRMALDLCRYGQRLPADYQFESNPPFAELYVDHQKFFEVLIGDDYPRDIAHFEKKIEALRGDYHEPLAIEVFMDLQIRSGHRDDAVKTMTEQMWRFFENGEVPSTVFEVAQTREQHRALAEKFRSENDFAGYAMAKLCENHCTK